MLVVITKQKKTKAQPSGDNDAARYPFGREQTPTTPEEQCVTKKVKKTKKPKKKNQKTIATKTEKEERRARNE